MKRILILTIMISTITISSCCRKEYNCPQSRVNLQFIGYADYEVDSIHVYRYEPLSDFSKLADSILYTDYYRKSNDTIVYTPANIEDNDENLLIEYDIIVYNVSTGQKDSISQIEYLINTYSLSCLNLGRNVKCLSTINNFKHNDVFLSGTDICNINK